MKISIAKKDRLKVYVLVGIGVGAAIYVLVQLVNFAIGKYRAVQVEIETTQKALDEAETTLDRLLQVREQNKEAKAELRRIDRENIVKADFGKYIYEVKPMVQDDAIKHDVEIDRVTGVQGYLHIPTPKRSGAESILRGYRVIVTGRAAYEDLIALFEEIEDGNPLVTVSSVQITARPGKGNEETHSVMFKVRYPIWENPGIWTNFVEDVMTEDDKEKDERK
jgi:hypothetical protein